MPIEFTPDEVSIIENMMLTNSHKSIAKMIEKPVVDVGRMVEAMCASRDLVSYQVRKKIPMFTPKTKLRKTEKQEDLTLRLRAKQREQDRIQRMKIEEQRRANKEKRDAESKFTTKKVDYSQKHLVRIDSKTYFYINPGENEQAARKKFMETYSKSFKKDEEHASPKEIITKVCRRCKEDKPVKRFYRDPRATDSRESVCIDCREEQKLIGKRKKR